MPHPNKTWSAPTYDIIHLYLLQQKFIYTDFTATVPDIIPGFLFVSYFEVATWLEAAVLSAPGVSLCHRCLPPRIQRSASVSGSPVDR